MAVTPTSKPTPRAADAAAGGKVQDSALAALGAITGQATQSDSGRVWWGAGPKQTVGSKLFGSHSPNLPGDVYLSKDDAYRQVWSWYGTSEYDKWADYLVSLGMIDEADKSNPNLLASNWYDAVDTAENMTKGGKKVKPWDAMRLIATDATKKNGGSAGGSKAGTQTATTTTNSAPIDADSAKALVNDVLAKKLGRAATPEELRQFTDMLHQAQEANPTTTTETRTYDETGNYSSSVSSSGGIDPAGLTQRVEDKAMESPDYGAHQAGTTYFNALMQAIHSPVR